MPHAGEAEILTIVTLQVAVYWKDMSRPFRLPPGRPGDVSLGRQSRSTPRGGKRRQAEPRTSTRDQDLPAALVAVSPAVPADGSHALAFAEGTEVQQSDERLDAGVGAFYRLPAASAKFRQTGALGCPPQNGSNGPNCGLLWV